MATLTVTNGAAAAAAAEQSTERLTRREAEILTLVAQGLTNREMANRLFVSRRAVDFHLESIYSKLGVSHRLMAVREAERLGLLVWAV
jgi:ATP/maltotriose-dependent transcriptional regulator MalT